MLFHPQPSMIFTNFCNAINPECNYIMQRVQNTHEELKITVYRYHHNGPEDSDHSKRSQPFFDLAHRLFYRVHGKIVVND